jgi:hypothetical protein
MVVHVAHVEGRNEYEILVRKTIREGKSRCRWEQNIKIYFKRIENESVDRIKVA